MKRKSRVDQLQSKLKKLEIRSLKRQKRNILYKRNQPILLGAIAIFLLTAAVAITLTFDAVHVEVRNVQIVDLKNNKANVPNYTFVPIDKTMKTISDLLYAAGIALLIYLMIDSRLRRYENNEFSENVFSAILKKFIPDELFEILNNDVFGKDVIRKNAVLEYIITNTDSGYKMRQFVKYDLYNINTKCVTETIEVSIGQSQINKTYFEKLQIEQDGIAKVYQDKDLDEILKFDETTNFSTASFPVTLKPKSTATIIFHAMNEYYSKTVVDYHFFSSSCINLELTIHKPSDCLVRIIPTFSQPLEPLFDNTDYALQYHPIKGLLLGQSIIYIIEKKEDNKSLTSKTEDNSKDVGISTVI